MIKLKVTGNAEDAMRQIEEKHYCAPFESDSLKLVRIAIGFSKEIHNIGSYIIG